MEKLSYELTEISAKDFRLTVFIISECFSKNFQIAEILHSGEY